MLRNLSEKFAAKFPATTLSYSMVKIACFDNVFADIFEPEASPVEGQSLQQKDKKRRKSKGKKNSFLKIEKPIDIVALISVHAKEAMS